MLVSHSHAALDAMIAIRDEGLIAGIGLSNVTLDQLDHAWSRTEIVCVQNAYNLADRSAEPLLRACAAGGSPSCRFFRLGRRSGPVRPCSATPVCSLQRPGWKRLRHR
jgi:pyridoxine 4-dehydrogenase